MDSFPGGRGHNGFHYHLSVQNDEEMPHTFVSCDYHCVFATKGRKPLLKTKLREDLFHYMGGVARKFGMRLLAVGGVEDHVHLLITLPATMSVSRALRLVKGSSARWIHRTFPGTEDFAWQEGYGAFSVSRSHRPKTIKYITLQPEHHRRVTFDDEFSAFLHRHDFLYGPQKSEPSSHNVPPGRD